MPRGGAFAGGMRRRFSEFGRQFDAIEINNTTASTLDGVSQCRCVGLKFGGGGEKKNLSSLALKAIKVAFFCCFVFFFFKYSTTRNSFPPLPPPLFCRFRFRSGDKVFIRTEEGSSQALYGINHFTFNNSGRIHPRISFSFCFINK